MKNLFELKNARRVLVEGNLMEYVWQEAQIGYAILLTPRNQDGKAPWVTIEDVTIRRNSSGTPVGCCKSSVRTRTFRAVRPVA